MDAKKRITASKNTASSTADTPTLITQLGHNDVLLGRGSTTTGPNDEHGGNKRFRIMAKHFIVLKMNKTQGTNQSCSATAAARQLSSKNKLLDFFAKQLVAMVHAKRGRFVRKQIVPVAATTSRSAGVANGVLYAVVPEDVAVHKSKQTVRHQLRIFMEDKSSDDDDDENSFVDKEEYDEIEQHGNGSNNNNEDEKLNNDVALSLLPDGASSSLFTSSTTTSATPNDEDFSVAQHRERESSNNFHNAASDEYGGEDSSAPQHQEMESDVVLYPQQQEAVSASIRSAPPASVTSYEHVPSARQPPRLGNQFGSLDSSPHIVRPYNNNNNNNSVFLNIPLPLVQILMRTPPIQPTAMRPPVIGDAGYCQSNNNNLVDFPPVITPPLGMIAHPAGGRTTTAAGDAACSSSDSPSIFHNASLSPSAWHPSCTTTTTTSTRRGDLPSSCRGNTITYSPPLQTASGFGHQTRRRRGTRTSTALCPGEPPSSSSLGNPPQRVFDPLLLVNNNNNNNDDDFVPVGLYPPPHHMTTSTASSPLPCLSPVVVASALPLQAAAAAHPSSASLLLEERIPTSSGRGGDSSISVILLS